MINPKQWDFTLYVGASWEQTLILYADSRVKRWRGTWQEWFVYKTGDAVSWEDEAYVATLESDHAEPGGPGTKPFWSPVERMNLTSYEGELVADEVFTSKPTIEGPLGRINVSVPASAFTDPPTSAHWYLKLTEPAHEIVIFPIHGTMLFKEP